MLVWAEPALLRLSAGRIGLGPMGGLGLPVFEGRLPECMLTGSSKELLELLKST
jgi:hypothetical protein